jgi:hypothetical protein
MMVFGKIITSYHADILAAGRVASEMLTAVYLPILIYLATPANVAYLRDLGLMEDAPSAPRMSEGFRLLCGNNRGTLYNVGRVG